MHQHKLFAGARRPTPRPQQGFLYDETAARIFLNLPHEDIDLRKISGSAVEPPKLGLEITDYVVGAPWRPFSASRTR